jgi:phosphoenolpyruvate-protein phosphotransferase
LSRILSGVAASPGIAVATPWRYLPSAATGGELPLVDASRRAAAELETLAQLLRDSGRAEEAQILDAQALMATDPALLDDAHRLVADGHSVAEAVRLAGEQAALQLEQLDDELLAARGADVRDVAGRIARIASGAERPRLDRRSIAIAADLPPSVTAELERSLLAGIALEGGSRTAHAAILARALGIPAVVGVGGLLDAVREADEIAVDGDAGEVLLDPDADEVARRRSAVEAASRADVSLASTPLATSDGTRMRLGANVGNPAEAEAALAAGAEAIGLFRTEFLFMGRREAPTAEEQMDAYAAAMRTFKGRPVVIRLLDVGGDKQLPYLALPHEDNPFLGVRGLRLAEGNEALLLTQIVAILMAAHQVEAEPWLMAPMVADLGDVYRLHELVAMAAFGRPVDRPPKVGVMIEVPAAVTLADKIAAEVAFMSIGTNDLTQYLLAADRTNPALAARQDALHPGVVRAVAATVEAGHASNIEVAVCGELAGDPAGAVVLAGLGVDELSMAAGSFASVKRALGRLSGAEASATARRVMDAETAAQARGLVEQLLAS